ncbi:MAG: Dabb family protein [Sedimentisphaerales bacterium]|nr:Dabb family protein [Sedimentisphaerales bacterium]
MARNVFYLVAGAILLAGCVNVEKTELLDTNRAEAGKEAVSEKTPEKLLRHVVLFRFKEDAKATDIKKVEQAFAALPGKIGAIYDFEWGTDVSTENLADGFTHCFVVTFKSEADRARYLPHPAHKAFGELLGPVLDKVLVVDYWTN